MMGLAIGQEARVTRVFSAADVAAYRALTGDAGLGYGVATVPTAVPGPLLGGMFSDLLGTKLPGRGTNWLKQSLRFHRVAELGDQVTAVVRITRLRPEKRLVNLRTTCVNSGGRTICDGEALVLVSDLAANAETTGTSKTRR